MERVSPLAWVLIAPIRFYQRFITPYTPASCRFYPTCSSYAVTALKRHGAFKGSWLTLRRLGRCHPWSDGGVDHVPPARERAAAPGSSVAVNVMPATSEPSVDAAPIPAATGADATPGATAADRPVRPRADAPPTDRSTAA